MPRTRYSTEQVRGADPILGARSYSVDVLYSRAGKWFLAIRWRQYEENCTNFESSPAQAL